LKNLCHLCRTVRVYVLDAKSIRVYITQMARNIPSFRYHCSGAILDRPPYPHTRVAISLPITIHPKLTKITLLQILRRTRQPDHLFLYSSRPGTPNLNVSVNPNARSNILFSSSLASAILSNISGESTMMWQVEQAQEPPHAPSTSRLCVCVV